MAVLFSTVNLVVLLIFQLSTLLQSVGAQAGSPPTSPSHTQHYGVIPILAITVILVVASFGLLLCSILFYIAKKRYTTNVRPNSHTALRKAFVSGSDNGYSEEGEERDSVCVLKETNSRGAFLKRMSVGRGLDDKATRFSDLLEFHTYPYNSHHNSSVQLHTVTQLETPMCA